MDDKDILKIKSLLKSVDITNIKLGIEIGLSLGYKFTNKQIDHLFMFKNTIQLGYDLALRTGYDFSDWVELSRLVYPNHNTKNISDKIIKYIRALTGKQIFNMHDTWHYPQPYGDNIPKCIEKMVRLRTLNLTYCNLTKIPDNVFRLPNIGSLVLHNNDINTIPKNIISIDLKYLGLNGTNINKLPEYLLFMDSLQQISLISTPITYKDPIVKELIHKGIRVVR